MDINRRGFLTTSMGFLAGAVAPNIFDNRVYGQIVDKRPNIILINTEFCDYYKNFLI